MPYKLEYKGKEHFAKTWACFVDHFPELSQFSTKVYNNRMELKEEDVFCVRRIEMLPRLKKILNDKRVKTKKNVK